MERKHHKVELCIQILRENTEHDPNRARIRRQSNVSKYRASQKSADVVCGPTQGKNREDPNGEYEGSVVCGAL